jgi:hypothetical protein
LAFLDEAGGNDSSSFPPVFLSQNRRPFWLSEPKYRLFGIFYILPQIFLLQDAEFSSFAASANHFYRTLIFFLFFSELFPNQEHFFPDRHTEY